MIADRPESAFAIDRQPTAAELRRMSGDGYLVLRNFFSPRQMTEMLGWTLDLVGRPQVRGGHWVYHETSTLDSGRRLIQRIENFCPFHLKFADLIQAGALPRWVSALMGGPVVLFKDKINLKMPGGAGFKAHQDQQAGWSAYAPLFLTAMISLDASTLTNGCLEIAAGRHREGLLGEQWLPLQETGLNLNPVPTNSGDVVFFDSFVPHASKANTTADPRRILYLTYNLASQGDHRERYYADKHAAFPPDIEREAGKSYVFRV